MTTPTLIAEDKLPAAVKTSLLATVKKYGSEVVAVVDAKGKVIEAADISIRFINERSGNIVSVIAGSLRKMKKKLPEWLEFVSWCYKPGGVEHIIVRGSCHNNTRFWTNSIKGVFWTHRIYWRNILTDGGDVEVAVVAFDPKVISYEEFARKVFLKGKGRWRSLITIDKENKKTADKVWDELKREGKVSKPKLKTLHQPDLWHTGKFGKQHSYADMWGKARSAWVPMLAGQMTACSLPAGIDKFEKVLSPTQYEIYRTLMELRKYAWSQGNEISARGLPNSCRNTRHKPLSSYSDSVVRVIRKMLPEFQKTGKLPAKFMRKDNHAKRRLSNYKKGLRLDG